LGSVGNGIWVNSLFNLDGFAGKTIRVRFVQTDLDLSVGAHWANFFGNALGNATRGWRIDDICVSGLVAIPLILGVDEKEDAVSACPVDPADNCNTVTADAGPDLEPLTAGALVELSAAGSTFDQCVDGFLQFRWRNGGVILQDYSTNPFLVDTPAVTTTYTVDVQCSTDLACEGSDTVVVTPPATGGVEMVNTRFDEGDDRVKGDAPDTDVVALLVRVDLKHDGSNMAAALTTGIAPELVSVLRLNSCGLAVMTPDSAEAAGSAVLRGSSGSHADVTTSLGIGGVVGYLPYAVVPNGPGSLGRLLASGQGIAGGRGTIAPADLGFGAAFDDVKNSEGSLGDCTP
jgi:hypothetical protein